MPIDPVILQQCKLQSSAFNFIAPKTVTFTQTRALPADWQSRLVQACVTALGLEINEAFITNHMQRHIREKPTLITPLLTIIYKKIIETDNADVKQSIAAQLIHEIDHCTDGFVNRIQAIVKGFQTAETILEMLQSERDFIIDRTAHHADPDVHVHNSFYLHAQELGFGVAPLNSVDSYITLRQHIIPPEMRRRLIIKAFRSQYHPLAIFTSLLDRLQSLLGEAGYTGRKTTPDRYSFASLPRIILLPIDDDAPTPTLDTIRPLLSPDEPLALVRHVDQLFFVNTSIGALHPMVRITTTAEEPVTLEGQFERAPRRQYTAKEEADIEAEMAALRATMSDADAVETPAAEPLIPNCPLKRVVRDTLLHQLPVTLETKTVTTALATIEIVRALPLQYCLKPNTLYTLRDEAATLHCVTITPGKSMGTITLSCVGDLRSLAQTPLTADGLKKINALTAAAGITSLGYDSGTQLAMTSIIRNFFQLPHEESLDYTAYFIVNEHQRIIDINWHTLQQQLMLQLVTNFFHVTPVQASFLINLFEGVVITNVSETPALLAGQTQLTKEQQLHVADLLFSRDRGLVPPQSPAWSPFLDVIIRTVRQPQISVQIIQLYLEQANLSREEERGFLIKTAISHIQNTAFTTHLLVAFKQQLKLSVLFVDLSLGGLFELIRQLPEAEKIPLFTRSDFPCKRNILQHALATGLPNIEDLLQAMPRAFLYQILSVRDKNGANALLLAARYSTPDGVRQVSLAMQCITLEDITKAHTVLQKLFTKIPTTTHHLFLQQTTAGYNALETAILHAPENLPELLLAIGRLPEAVKTQLFTRHIFPGNRNLFEQALFNNSPYIEYLLQAMPIPHRLATLSTVNRYGYNALMSAAKNNTKETLQSLMVVIMEMLGSQQTFQILLQESMLGLNALEIALRFKPGNITVLLTAIATLPVEQQSHLFTRRQLPDNRSLLQYAIEMGLTEAQALLQATPVEIKRTCFSTMTPGQSNVLMLASQHQTPEFVLALINGIQDLVPQVLPDLLLQASVDGYNALELAALHKPDNMAPLLLESIATLLPEQISYLFMRQVLPGNTSLLLYAIRTQSPHVSAISNAMAEEELFNILSLTDTFGCNALMCGSSQYWHVQELLIDLLQERLTEPHQRHILLQESIEGKNAYEMLIGNYRWPAVRRLLHVTIQMPLADRLQLIERLDHKFWYLPLYKAAMKPIQQITKLEHALKELEQHIQTLVTKKAKKYLLAKTVHDELVAAVSTFKQDLTVENRSQKSSALQDRIKEIITPDRWKILSTHRGIKDTLLKILLCVSVIGAIYFALSSRNGFFKTPVFKTTSEKRLDVIQHEVDALQTLSG